jgi:hypothetical protein
MSAIPISQGLEKQLFTWLENESVPDAYIYYGCTTKVQMGKYPAGSKIYSIMFEILRSTMSLYETETEDDEDNDTPVVIALQLSVKNT